MRYREYVQNELSAIEKRFNLDLDDLNWIESLLSDIYENGCEYKKEGEEYQRGYDNFKAAE